MKIDGIVETAIHVADVARSEEFYRRLFAFPKIDGNARFCAFLVPKNALFLLFQKGGTLEPVQTPGGAIPPHDGSGRMHFAFKISKESLAECERELAANGIPIESRVEWPLGGTSLYFRDPDEHLVELITPGCWPVY